ncbi:MAG: patatin-like phospholipase family protein [Leadbetterella sp.]
MEKPKIRLGICMAGAVSAGAFTAGVMDYLIETLERWEIAKQEIDKKNKAGEPLTEREKLIPNYDVVIEVLSGASAGGMTAAILSYSFMDGKYITTRNNTLIDTSYNYPNDTDQTTKLYNAWINMADSNKETTFDKMMDNANVKAITEMNSIFNNKAIDEIAEKTKPNEFPNVVAFPKYISKDLSVFLTVTNLEGLPIEIKFGNSDDTRNEFKMHSGFLHYNFSDKKYINFDYPAQKIDASNFQNLLTAAKSTGAFPFGFENQKVSIGNAFMQGYKERLKSLYGIELNDRDFKGKDYEFTAVDGGLINNEPTGTTIKFLNECVLDKNHQDWEKEKQKNYVLLIDPFPNITNADKIEKHKPIKDKYNVFQLALKLFGAVRNQSMFKQEDLLESLNMKNNKYLIYPSKRGKYFLACGELGGFSGFLKKAFRTHDYQLGRKNAQSFISYYFGENEADLKKLGLAFTPDQVSFWKYYPKRDETKPPKLPLIPDLLWLNQESMAIEPKPQKKGEEISYPDYNGLTTEEFSKLIFKTKERVKAIIEKSFHLISEADIPLLGKAAVLLFKNKIKKGIQSKIMISLESYLFDTFKPQKIKQKDLIQLYSNHIKSNGQTYKKIKGVYAVEAVGGELVESITSGGFETKAIAPKGSFIVTNDTTAKEQYIIQKIKFETIYEKTREPNYYEKKDNFHITGLEFTRENFLEILNKNVYNEQQNKEVYIETAWHESQVLKEGDMLVSNKVDDREEIYRIARKEFEETYQAI